VEAHITRNALDRVPLSLIIDDSTVLVNLNYFWMRDRNPVDGQNRRWQDVPVVHPESFTREFAEFCLTEGVRGKFSIVPYPAALGRVDETLPLFGRAQQDSWMAMCRELIVPAFDITPEMLTHTTLVDPDTLQTIDPSIWEQYDWRTLPEDEPERVIAYISKACEILVRAGFSPQGVTSPGGFGGRRRDTMSPSSSNRSPTTAMRISSTLPSGMQTNKRAPPSVKSSPVLVIGPGRGRATAK